MSTTSTSTSTSTTRTGFAQRLVERIAGRSGPDRRGFLAGSALVGAALTVSPWSYLTRPASAYDAVCGDAATCAGGYTVFCCTINGGQNSCPPNSFIAGWWKADNSSFCGGAARYYVDCNAFKDGAWSCGCNTSPDTCDNRLIACNQFRYGQCNTQVPLSNSGPVVCRLVSCTPPWEQYAGVCSSSSRTDNSTVSHTAPCLTDTEPLGRVDSITVSGTTVRIRGWAFDRDQPTTAIPIAIYRDGAGLGWFPTDTARPDVNSAYGISGTHGFDVSLTVPPGTYTFSVYAINAPGQLANPLIGSPTATVAGDLSPVGVLDSATADGPVVRLRGWAFDPDVPGQSISVAVYEDGRGLRWYPTDQDRADVNNVYGLTGRHGFDISVTTTSGTHTYDIFGISVGPIPGTNPVIASATLAVNPDQPPAGWLDSLTITGNTVGLVGWSFDADQPSKSIGVRVTTQPEGGPATSRTVTANVTRNDVNAAFGLTGKHGYDTKLDLPNGPHRITVAAVNAGPGTQDTVIADRRVEVNPGEVPRGALDTATTGVGRVTLTGWAYDPDDPTVETTVAVYANDTLVGTFGTGLARPDVDAVFGITGRHGFSASFNAAAGPYTWQVYAINILGGPGNPLIGTLTGVVA